MRQSETFFYDYKCRKTSKQPTSLRLKIFAWIPYKIDILCSVPGTGRNDDEGVFASLTTCVIPTSFVCHSV